MYCRTETPIGDDETLDELRGRLVEIGTDQLVRALADGFEPEPQVGDPVYAAKITAAGARSTGVSRPSRSIAG